jgi:2-polyprenyl-3-methyl-5-hydroxy-6-metoxy-1,4-benzoquinol methylase
MNLLAPRATGKFQAANPNRVTTVPHTPGQSSQPSQSSWRPDSDLLELCDGMWRPRRISQVSYPDNANEVCFQVEDDSFWFRHRNDCILAAVRRFPPGGRVFDIGGGNGFVASAMQGLGLDVVLVEPGSGARNALSRGVRDVVSATLEDACFLPHSLPAAGAFDVVEHLPDDVAFLRDLHAKLVPGGMLYCTVPASAALWSGADVHAGHFRRYSRKTLVETLQSAGFEVEFASYFFSWLALPVFFLRALPHRAGLRGGSGIGTVDATRLDHRVPRGLSGLARGIHAWELGRLRDLRPLAFGTSLLCVARAGTTP